MTTTPTDLARLLTLPDREIVAAGTGGLSERAALFCRHRFDLLGSGWVSAAYGEPSVGLRYVLDQQVESAPVYGPEPTPRIDADGDWLRNRVPPQHLAASRAAWQLIDTGYEPIDWHRDLKSGYRWPAQAPARQITFGDAGGADVKVPWELARMQHLPQLAWASILAGGDYPADYHREIRHQILDFIATNPPGYGVNWLCMMDVALRAISWLVADDMLRAAGAGLDDAFCEVFRHSLRTHGRAILADLGWRPAGENHNHYLAHIVGLLFLGAYLPPQPETDAWLAFALDQLLIEARAQFLSDGANFEAATAYHQLSTEMLLFSSALVLALPSWRWAGLRSADARWLPDPTGLPAPAHRVLRAEPDTMLAELGTILRRATSFLADTTAPDGELIRIGDCDSGGLLKLAPVYERLAPAAARSAYVNLTAAETVAGDDYWDERHLASGPLLAALGAITGAPVEVPHDQEGPAQLLAVVIAGLAGGRVLPTAAIPPPGMGSPVSPPASGLDHSEIRLQVSGEPLTLGLRVRSYPDFGLFVIRSSRLYLTLRCGERGHRPRCHAHVDQLSLEVWVDGKPWIRDPGSGVYTPLPELRDSYRRSSAHFVPYIIAEEGRIFEPGLFDLDLDAELFAWECVDHGIDSRLLLAGHSLHVRLRVEDAEIRLRTTLLAAAPGPRLELCDVTRTFPEDAAEGPASPIPFSPSYGIQLRDGSALIPPAPKKIVLSLLTWNTRDISLESLAALVREAEMLRSVGLVPYLVVCDNGSSDGTQQALLTAVEDLRIIPHRLLLNEHNRGSSIARNQVIDVLREVDGDYLLFLDGDIEPVPFSSFAMFRHLEAADPRVGCLGAHCEGQTRQREKSSPHLLSVADMVLADDREDLWVAWTQYGLFRRQVFDAGVRFEEADPFDGAGWGCEDVDLAFQMHDRGFYCQAFSGMVYLHRNLNSSIPLLRKTGLDPAKEYDLRRFHVIRKWEGKTLGRKTIAFLRQAELRPADR